MLESALEISRAEAGVGRADFERFDAGEILRDLYEIYLPMAQTKDVKITLTCASDLPVHGNRALVARALANLIDNALKYGAEGGEVTLAGSTNRTAVHLAVADSAKGIPASCQSEALRKFGRLDPARSSPGSGLGLSMVKAVASLHRGEFMMQDNQPGLRATLILPATP